MLSYYKEKLLNLRCDLTYIATLSYRHKFGVQKACNQYYQNATGPDTFRSQANWVEQKRKLLLGSHLQAAVDSITAFPRPEHLVEFARYSRFCLQPLAKDQGIT